KEQAAAFYTWNYRNCFVWRVCAAGETDSVSFFVASIEKYFRYQILYRGISGYFPEIGNVYGGCSAGDAAIAFDEYCVGGSCFSWWNCIDSFGDFFGKKMVGQG